MVVKSLSMSTSPGNLEAYSWGVDEDEPREGLYCGFESVVGTAAISV